MACAWACAAALPSPGAGLNPALLVSFKQKKNGVRGALHGWYCGVHAGGSVGGGFHVLQVAPSFCLLGVIQLLASQVGVQCHHIRVCRDIAGRATHTLAQHPHLDQLRLRSGGLVVLCMVRLAGAVRDAGRHHHDGPTGFRCQPVCLCPELLERGVYLLPVARPLTRPHLHFGRMLGCRLCALAEHKLIGAGAVPSSAGPALCVAIARATRRACFLVLKIGQALRNWRLALSFCALR
mmetsp:Transcript_37152/g.104863  ORF Transcript_37152/g.104863 Transcript_37152/m.104863 type:complete len:237 (-) Transcript_37152:42-752(-)